MHHEWFNKPPGWSIVSLLPWIYIAPLWRYGASKITGSQPWPFGVTWRQPRHRSCDPSTRDGPLPMGGPLWPCIYLAPLWRHSTGLKDNWVTTITFWGHVASSVTWPLDSR